jgi:hypothetical protein
MLRREPPDVREVEVQCDETKAFQLADFVQACVLNATQMLAADGRNVMTGSPEELLRACAEVLVELELHLPEPAATGT